MKQLSNCPVCLSTSIRRRFSCRESLGSIVRVDECTGCGCGFVNPQPDWEELAPWYSDSYSPYDVHHTAGEDDEAVLETARSSGELRHVPFTPGSRLLDVGCGGGYFLGLAIRLGVEAQGVEPSKVASERARAYGFKVYTGTLEEFVGNYDGPPFDVVCANHVLEHVPDPVSTLAAMRSLLVKHGQVVVTVPNARCPVARQLRGLWHSTDVPRHLMQFDTNSLKLTAAKAGFRTVQVSTYSLPKATASSIRCWLRAKLLVPRRLSDRVSMIDSLVAPFVAKTLDRNRLGEALIGRFSEPE